jgi:hypothetical protein
VVRSPYAMPNRPRFTKGDRVRWVRAVALPENRNAVGVIVAVIPNDTNVDDFTMYDITFPFGTLTLYGTQIEPADLLH